MQYVQNSKKSGMGTSSKKESLVKSEWTNDIGLLHLSNIPEKHIDPGINLRINSPCGNLEGLFKPPFTIASRIASTLLSTRHFKNFLI